MIAEVEEIINELAHGRMVVLVDDEDRENEGDLLAAARFVTPEMINFMSHHGRGLICLTLTEAHCRHLGLALVSENNRSAFGTNFTVPIEAAANVTTGISAHDRATTILAASNPNAQPSDVVTPGHVFPVRAEPGGVLMRAGHTEAGCDLTQMAGLFPAAVICEIMNEDGSMARMPDLRVFADRHNLKIGTIKSLIEYRLKTELLVEREYDSVAATVFGEFKLTAYRDTIDRRLHIAFYRGTLSPQSPVLVRVIINPTPLDGLLSAQPTPSWGLARVFERISAEDAGVILMLATDERDDDKLRRQIGLEPAVVKPPGGNLRHYGLGAQILRDLGVGKMRLLSSRFRLPNMEGFGLSVEEIIEPPDADHGE